MKDPLLAIRNGEKLSLRDEIMLILKLSFPAILAQISSTIMQYIDASMVGHLGPNASASIGLVSSSTWLVGGVMTAASLGFSVLVAQRIGARDEEGARTTVRWGLFFCLAFSIILCIIGAAASRYLPVWMGGEPAIRKDSSAYFLVYALSIPIREMLFVSQGMIQSSGNIRLPSILNICMCFLDVVFNALLIPIFGVVGAALGTALAIAVIAVIMMHSLLLRSPVLHLAGRSGDRKYSFSEYCSKELLTVLKIAIPVAIDNIIMGFAYVAFTRIVSPFGTTSIAANLFP